MHPEDPLAQHFRLNAVQQRALERLGLATVEDLLRHLPQRYGRDLPVRTIAELAKGEEATIYAQVLAAKTSKAFRKRIPMGEIMVEDQSGKIKAVWFHQPYLAKKVPVGQTACLSGKIMERKGELYLANPEINFAAGGGGGATSLFAAGEKEKHLLPIYSETQGLSSNWFYHAIQKILKTAVQQILPDPLPLKILEKYHLPSLATALIWIHCPKTEKDALVARKRFAFEEIFLIQLSRLRIKQEYQKPGAFKIKVDFPKLDDFIAHFSFQATDAQHRVIKQIVSDLAGAQPMTRLLEGDVGSGKTAVAAATAAAVVNAGFSVAYMAPTEILARQHFESFIKYFTHQPKQIGLITGTECRKFPSKINLQNHTDISRAQLLKWVANGEIPILIGTHALIQEKVKFKNLAYVIIDEQHRFGVNQRAKLARKNGWLRPAPHLLSMTATPIPRTLALTLYGDLDLSLLDELPAGRRPINTVIVPEEERPTAYEQIRGKLKSGRQAYVICPRIEEPDPMKELALNVKSAKAEAARLAKQIFPDFRVGLIHSKLKPSEKEQVMADFVAGKINLLVATSVIEVGVNVPNATMIVIEGAERFGLAQLHQLRGRVFRSSHQADCFLFTTSGHGNARLQALKNAANGFDLAEMDLRLRGPGALGGGKQWGLSDVGMEALKNLKMVEAARTEAQNLLAEDSALKNHQLIRERLSLADKLAHFE